MKNVIIAAYLRSPFTPAHKGALAATRPDEIAGQLVKALVEQSAIAAEDIEDLILGCAFPEGEQGMNMARLLVHLADLPQTIAGCTINRFCGSSMQAIHHAAGAIQMNAGEVFLCAGVESMTRIPMGGYNFLPHPGLYQKFPQAYMSMGETAENLAARYAISRTEQEQFALHSQQKAFAAQQQGKFDDEVIAIKNAQQTLVGQDGCLRPDSTLNDMAQLQPAFLADGSVTAATSSPLTDGAAAVLVCSETYAKQHGLPKLARIKAIAVSACQPEIMGIGPVEASRKALQRAGLSLSDIDIVELNEAFSAQALAVLKEMPVSDEKLNIDGGAIALGHPLGATGARITGKAASLLQREGKQFALATQCIGGGQGIATILEAVS